LLSCSGIQTLSTGEPAAIERPQQNSFQFETRKWGEISNLIKRCAHCLKCRRMRRQLRQTTVTGYGNEGAVNLGDRRVFGSNRRMEKIA
jgi:hypothetical protein